MIVQCHWDGSVCREPGVPVTAAGQPRADAGAGPTGPSRVHGAHRPRPVLVRVYRGAVSDHGQLAVPVLDSDGPQYGTGYRAVHIVQRRGVRTQAPRRAHVRPERVLFRRLLLRHYRVRYHRQLEDDHAHHRRRAHV